MKRVQFKRTKSVISIVLSLVLILSIFAAVPVHAGAAETNVAATAADGVYTVSNEDELLAAVAAVKQKDSGEYDIIINGDFESSGFSFDNPVTVNVYGTGTITIAGAQTQLYVGENCTLNFGKPGVTSNLTFQGKDGENYNDTSGFVSVHGENAVCNMYDGITFKNRKGENSLGGGFAVCRGTFNMIGGLITNCGIEGGSVCYGGGVAVYSGGRFNMSGGTISDCYTLSDYVDLRPDGEYHPTAMGGGVMVSSGSVFKMTGGTIENNTATNFGGGVCVVQTFREYAQSKQFGFFNSRVEISGGTISGNKAKSGAGVFASGIHITYFSEYGTGYIDETGENEKPGVDIQGGSITGNIASENGGGVLFEELDPSLVANIKNAIISENKAINGAGVCIDKYWTQADIDNCTIKNNVASSSGGGVYILKNNEDRGSNGTHIKDTTITGNTSGDRGAGVYYDIDSKLTISGKNIIQDNTYDGKLNNLNVFSVKNPVYIDGELTGSKIGLSDPTLWGDNKEDTDEEAVSTLRLTGGFKTNNNALIPADVFTSDHESWIVDYGEKYVSPIPVYNYTAQRYDNTKNFTEGYEIHTRDNGDLYIKVPASTFSGYTENVAALYNELCNLYNNNSNYDYIKDYELYGYLSDYPGKIYYDSIVKTYVAVFKMKSSSVYVFTSSNPDAFENLEYDNALFMASGGVQGFLNDKDKEESILALKVYYYYDESDLSGLFGSDYTEEELKYDEPIDFQGEDIKTVYKINPYGYATTKYVINKGSLDDGSYDYTNEVRLVRRSEPIKFHVNEPEKDDRLFRVYNPKDGEDYTAVENGTYSLNENYRISEFYNIPSFAEDDYVFGGWYYHADGDKDGEIPFGFDSEIPGNLTDVYAHWIPVGTVAKDTGDDKVLPNEKTDYSGFELFGVQIRPEANFDSNYGDYTPGGLRFITSISEELLNNVDALSEKKVNGNKVEYGFVTAAKSTVDTFVGDSEYLNLSAEQKARYTLKYKGENVNGVDTTVKGKVINNYNYVTNVDCTSKVGEFGSNARIKEDHRNYSNYRLATYVVTYNGSEADKGADIVARAYMRYYDANGLLRTFYNDYSGTKVYGGCSTSYNSVKEIASNTNTAQ